MVPQSRNIQVILGAVILILTVVAVWVLHLYDQSLDEYTFQLARHYPAIHHRPVPVQNVSAKQGCPEEWIVNTMPSGDAPAPAREYFIYQGVRHELSEFDISWVQTNCNLKPSYVY
ncbi:MAG: hypothetical protein HY978_01530 [Candidatus Liptonbacteria bacterium]|nr:hypothetical protein [Candidatus Liptonbacteria bacterium]